MSTVNLVKGQKISLEKPGGGVLTKVFMGLGWDPAAGQDDIDLDASCICFDANKRVIDIIYFGQLQGAGGSVIHSGDNLTGDGDGDDEVINVDLSKVPANIESLVFTINSFQGQTFNQVANCFARLVDASSRAELCIFKLAEKGANNAVIMCRVYRHNGQWKISALGNPATGRTANDLVGTITNMF
jgi:tellurium resistance protein TerZ